MTIDLNCHKLSRSLTANETYGMVIHVNGGNLTITDETETNIGSIEGGRSYNGAGVLCEEGSTLTINGGTFRNNMVSTTENGSHGRGGAIYMNPNTTLTFIGGIITENTASTEGGGIYLGDDAIIRMWGAPVVKDNVCPGSPNLCLRGKTIDIIGKFITGAEVWLTPGVARGPLTTNFSEWSYYPPDPNTIFKIDDGLGTIMLKDGEAYYTTTDFITDVMIAVGKGNRDSKVKEGWTAIDKDLNAGAGGAYVYLLYKKESSTGSSGTPITDFYLKTGSSPSSLEYINRTYYPASGAGGTNLNYDTWGGTKIYLFYTKDAFADERGVADIYFDATRAGAVPGDGGATGLDLNKDANGEFIFMHVNYPILDNIRYVERSYDTKQKEMTTTTKICSDFTRLTSNTNDNHTVLTDGWYVVDENVEFEKYLEISGKVHIILVDGRTLNAKEGIFVDQKDELHIYGQEGEVGRIYAHSSSGPGIGGHDARSAGRISIHGSIIDAQGSKDNAAIGGSSSTSGSIQTISIYGGTITAQGGDGGAGIGSGKKSSDASYTFVHIYGGTVTATGGNSAAGIGSGSESDCCYIDIYSSTVLAKGGSGAGGIGCGNNGDLTGDITIGDALMMSYSVWDNDFQKASTQTWNDVMTKNYSILIQPCDHADATYRDRGDGTHIADCNWCKNAVANHTYTYQDGGYYCIFCKTEKPANIAINDGQDNSEVLTQYTGKKVDVTYDRILSTTDNVNGSWASKAYTVCLPYTKDLQNEFNNGQVRLYELAIVNDAHEFVFNGVVPAKIQAGKPYLVVVDRGTIDFSANNVELQAVPEQDEDDGVIYPDFESWKNRKNSVGWWRGTFSPIENEDATQQHLFALNSDGKWQCINNDTETHRNAYIPTFRAYYLPKEFSGDMEYTNKFTILEGGGDPSDIWLRLPDSYEGDIDNGGETSIQPVIHTIDLDGTDTYYDLQGRKLQGKPTQKGVYIYKGKKGSVDFS